MVEFAVILAAGSSQRLHPANEKSPPSKPATRVAGVPLIVRTMASLEQAGIHRIVVVTGYRAAEVEEAARSYGARRRLDISFAHNPDWTKGNGISVLAARPLVMGEFLLLMSDHIFHPDHLRTLLAEEAQPESGGTVLAVDYDVDRIFDLEDATLVRTDGRRQILDIGKQIEGYDAVDTGAFRCTRGLFEALETTLFRRGDCSLTDGAKRLAVSGKMRAIDIGDLWWLDVDTPEALALAERVLSKSHVQMEVGSLR